MITEQDAIEQYVATRISQPFNWTKLTIVELVRADRITLTSASKSLTDEVREFESIEDWQDAFGEDLFPPALPLRSLRDHDFLPPVPLPVPLPVGLRSGRLCCPDKARNRLRVRR